METHISTCIQDLTRNQGNMKGKPPNLINPTLDERWLKSSM